jgi:hypothetical protein
MHLPAMMRLVVEEVDQHWGERLFDVRGAREGAVPDLYLQCRVVEAVDIAEDPFVLGAARCTKSFELVEQGGIEPVRRVALTRKAPQPDPIRDQEMVEGAVDRFEERAAIGTVGLVGKLFGRRVDALVRPGVIGGEHREMGLHHR